MQKTGNRLGDWEEYQEQPPGATIGYFWLRSDGLKMGLRLAGSYPKDGESFLASIGEWGPTQISFMKDDRKIESVTNIGEISAEEIARIPDGEKIAADYADKKWPLSQIMIARLAALADCFEGVNLDRVDHYRQALRAGERIEPIKVCRMNRQGFYVLSDGNHRTLAHVLEGRNTVPAEIDLHAGDAEMRWRWPRISPITHTIELLGMPHVRFDTEKNAMPLCP